MLRPKPLSRTYAVRQVASAEEDFDAIPATTAHQGVSTHTRRHRTCEETDERFTRLSGASAQTEEAVCLHCNGRTVYRPGSEAADAFTECTDDERDTGRLFSHTRKTCSGAPQWQRAIGVGNVRDATDERWKQVRQVAQLLLLEYSH